MTSKHFVIIKGGKADALSAAAGRRLDLKVLRTHTKFPETHGYIEASPRALIEWFCSTNVKAPFPIGTLLFYNEVAA